MWVVVCVSYVKGGVGIEDSNRPKGLAEAEEIARGRRRMAYDDRESLMSVIRVNCCVLQYWRCPKWYVVR